MAVQGAGGGLTAHWTHCVISCGQDEKSAVVFFEKAVYSWDDIALLPFIEQELVSG